MDIFETRLIRVRRIFRFIVPILFAAVLCLIFYLGIARTQTDSLEKEQVTLTQALEGGAVRTYALSQADTLRAWMNCFRITILPMILRNLW